MAFKCYGCGAPLKGPHSVPAHAQWTPECTEEMRFDGRCQKLKTGCIIWRGRIDDWGYGQVGIKKKCTQAHRYNWMRHNGPIPDGLIVLHKCHNPACVNVEHLRLGTNKENTADMLKAGRAGWWEGPRVSLDEEKVREIRRDFKRVGKRTNATDLAKRWPGVSREAVYHAGTGRTWKHLL